MNNTLFYVVCIVALVMGANTIKTYLETRSSRSEDDGSELEDTLAKIAALEERVRVLERIVTENKYDLKREINKL